MRWVVYGAGAVGGVVGGRLAETGEDVVLIARGRHADTMRAAGLRVDSPVGSVTVTAPVVARPTEAEIGVGDIVLLAMKSHQTRQALDDLVAVAPEGTAIVCLQNGVENEREALRRFPNVYGVCVMCPAGHLVPGVVEAYSTPVTGILDVGRFPSGVDHTAETIQAAFRRATFSSEARQDIMRWKYAKLLMNLTNAIEAVCGRRAREGPIAAHVRDEGIACLRAAQIEFASDAEDAQRRGNLLDVRPINGRSRGGGSSWQSLQRRARSIETDYLNGEIVLLGRLYGVETPANALVQRLARELARSGQQPGSVSEAELMSLLRPRG
jgi:2-dehydropantoate 2-reductase